MNKAVLINESKGNVVEIDLDIDPVKKEIFKILSGPATFIGQWPNLDVVIMKCVNGTKENENTLPPPFHEEIVLGKILLVRMDKDSEPQDFTLQEYLAFIKEKSSE